MSESEKSVYEQIGGEPAMDAAVKLFYEKVLADDLLRRLFTERKPRHVDHLTLFTAESFGGPDRFSRGVGFRHLIDVHRHLHITDEERERFVALYLEAIDEAGLPADARFRQAIREHLDFGATVAQQNSWAKSEAELHPIRDVPQWTWPKEE